MLYRVTKPDCGFLMFVLCCSTFQLIWFCYIRFYVSCNMLGGSFLCVMDKTSPWSNSVSQILVGCDSCFLLCLPSLPLATSVIHSNVVMREDAAGS